LPKSFDVFCVFQDSLLVVGYAERGSLLSFMKAETVSWPELCRMLRDISHGLAAMHSGFQTSGHKMSPSICHRYLPGANPTTFEFTTSRLERFYIGEK
jgi:serine/threonine protein kinase